MLLTLYKGLTSVSTPLLEVYLKRRLKQGKEDPARTGERRGQPSRPRENKPLVWFHAASVGESQALLTVINRLLTEYPAIQVMVTTGTVTSAKLMGDRLPSGAFHQYIPVDHPAWTEKFLNHWRPDFIVWSESDFWPNMLTGIRKRGIPAVLLNARMSEKSFKNWQLARGVIRDILGTFKLCLGQNQTEVDRLKQLGAAETRVSGNLKYAAAPLPFDAPKLEALKEAIGTRPHVLWASTHPGEEEIAFRVHNKLKQSHHAVLTIIVPRHPQRGTDIAAMADNAELKYGLRSQNHQPRRNDDIYIADTLGELGLFFRLCPVCVMGGSFVPIGGHNPIEPAQLGCLIFYGPHMFNFVSICSDFESRNAARRVDDDTMLGKALELALREPEHFAPVSAAAKAWTEQQAHVLDDIAAALAPFIKELLPAPQRAAS